MTTRPVHTVLLDADGVLQAPQEGWLERWRPHAGDDLEGFVGEMFVAEQPALTGDVGLRESVETFLRERGGAEPDPAVVEEIVSGWAMIEVFGEAFALVDEIRGAGVRCHLASNQQVFRRDVMLDLGYREHVDRTFFSCDLGVAKPDPEYFRAILRDLRCGPEGVVFVDDREDNVEAARSVGIAAYVHRAPTSSDHGVADLRMLLREAGVAGL